MSNLSKNTMTFVISIMSGIMFLFFINVPCTPMYMSFYIIIGLSAALTIALNTINYQENRFLNVYIAIIIITLVIIPIANSSIFHSDSFSKKLIVEDINSSKINFTAHRTVTLSMANIIANKVLGKKFNGVQISSQYEINLDAASVQEVNGKLVWVMPLDFSGFFKWLKQDYIPGYIIVSATNPNAKAKLVLDYKMKTSKNSYFMHSIDRLSFFLSNFNEVETHFEISDKGEPFFISLVTKPTIFLNAKTAGKIVVINAETEHAETFKNAKEALEFYPWIDRLISEKYTEEKIEWYGSLQNGFWNTIFGGLNINNPTVYNGRELWLVEVNGRTMYFTGMSSDNNKDQSLVQGVLVDTKTRKALAFDLSGVMDESGAVSVIDSSLGANSMKWDPVLPQPNIINGEFYWGAPIVSASGIFQKVGMVKGDEPSKVYTGESYNSLIQKIKNNKGEPSYEESSKEVYVKISKRKLDLILLKIEELNKLTKSLR